MKKIIIFIICLILFSTLTSCKKNDFSEPQDLGENIFELSFTGNEILSDKRSLDSESYNDKYGIFLEGLKMKECDSYIYSYESFKRNFSAMGEVSYIYDSTIVDQKYTIYNKTLIKVLDIVDDEEKGKYYFFDEAKVDLEYGTQNKYWAAYQKNKMKTAKLFEQKWSMQGDKHYEINKQYVDEALEVNTLSELSICSGQPDVFWFSELLLNILGSNGVSASLKFIDFQNYYFYDIKIENYNFPSSFNFEKSSYIFNFYVNKETNEMEYSKTINEDYIEIYKKSSNLKKLQKTISDKVEQIKEKAE